MTWCLGGQAYVGGPFNFTHNADSSKEEYLVVVREDSTVQVHERWFDELWGRTKAMTAVGVVQQLRSKSERRSTSMRCLEAVAR